MELSKYAVLALIVFGRAVQAQPPTFVIHGMVKTCNAITELDRARSMNFMQYFWGWRVQDYDAAIAWANACGQFGWPAWSPTRVSFLESRREQLQRTTESTPQHSVADQEALQTKQSRDSALAAEKAVNEKAANERADAERAAAEKADAAEARKQTAIRVAAAQKAKAMRDCKASQPYRLYLAQEAVLADLKEKDRWERALAKEQKIAEISGSENLSAKYYDGMAIVHADEEIDRDFRQYQNAGGAANGPLGVSADLANPCRSARELAED
jgi:hypothetical protein